MSDGCICPPGISIAWCPAEHDDAPNRARLQSRLAQMEQSNGELRSENERLKDRIAQLEATQYRSVEQVRQVSVGVDWGFAVDPFPAPAPPTSIRLDIPVSHTPLGGGFDHMDETASKLEGKPEPEPSRWRLLEVE